MATAEHPGALLREWRLRRNLSQFDLASRSAVSGRHLSFIETGRARPSREMILHLAQRLDIPLRDRNRLLLAAGFAPSFGERRLDDDALASVRGAIERFLAALDRHWNIVAANSGLAAFTQTVAPELLEPPVNALRATLHPAGMAPLIVNFTEWSGHLLDRLRRQAELTADPELDALYDELAGYPWVATEPPSEDVATEVMLPLQVRVDGLELSFFSSVPTFATALDVTLQELAIEAFYPADAATAAALGR